MIQIVENCQMDLMRAARELRVKNKERDREEAIQKGWTHLHWNVRYDRWYGLPPGEKKSPMGYPNQVEHWPWGSLGYFDDSPSPNSP